ncbi:hypothetical protein TYRP_006470 [Tyrophagus putrescentiae]|nr:hypothetical protein TYRP_006470 [Tyrophagus putrescentiae]
MIRPGPSSSKPSSMTAISSSSIDIGHPPPEEDNDQQHTGQGPLSGELHQRPTDHRLQLVVLDRIGGQLDALAGGVVGEGEHLGGGGVVSSGVLQPRPLPARRRQRPPKGEVVHEEDPLDGVDRLGAAGLARVRTAAGLVGAPVKERSPGVVHLGGRRRRVDDLRPGVAAQAHRVHQVDVQESAVLEQHPPLGEAAVLEGRLRRRGHW